MFCAAGKRCRIEFSRNENYLEYFYYLPLCLSFMFWVKIHWLCFLSWQNSMLILLYSRTINLSPSFCFKTSQTLMHLEVRTWNLLYHAGNKPNMYIKIHLYIRFSICSTKIDFLLPHNDFTLVPPACFPSFFTQTFASRKMSVSKIQSICVKIEIYIYPWSSAESSGSIYTCSCCISVIM